MEDFRHIASKLGAKTECAHLCTGSTDRQREDRLTTRHNPVSPTTLKLRYYYNSVHRKLDHKLVSVPFCWHPMCMLTGLQEMKHEYQGG